MMRQFLILLCLASGLPGAVPPLLQEVANKLAEERHTWAFTQLARETTGDGTTVERLERYDPDRGDAHRWELLRLNGRTPTPNEQAAWTERKNRARKRPPNTLGDYVDLERAQVQREDTHSVSYEVPLKNRAGGLFPGGKVDVVLTINKHTRELERAQASIDGPFNIALGLARVLDLDLDLTVPNDAPLEKPTGTASAVVKKFGRRVEYYWSDFSRVTGPVSPPARATAP